MPVTREARYLSGDVREECAGCPQPDALAAASLLKGFGIVSSTPRVVAFPLFSANDAFLSVKRGIASELMFRLRFSLSKIHRLSPHLSKPRGRFDPFERDDLTFPVVQTNIDVEINFVPREHAGADSLEVSSLPRHRDLGFIFPLHPKLKRTAIANVHYGSGKDSADMVSCPVPCFRTVSDVNFPLGFRPVAVPEPSADSNRHERCNKSGDSADGGNSTPKDFGSRAGSSCRAGWRSCNENSKHSIPQRS